MAVPDITNPAEIIEIGERIYKEKYQLEYEPKYGGSFLAINVLDGMAYLGETSAGALEKARATAPSGIFHLIRIGSPGAFRVSYSNGALDWLFR
jgi:hypothetical protein